MPNKTNKSVFFRADTLKKTFAAVVAALTLVGQVAGTASPMLFASHVHLHKGEDSLQAYELK